MYQNISTHVRKNIDKIMTLRTQMKKTPKNTPKKVEKIKTPKNTPKQKENKTPKKTPKEVKTPIKETNELKLNFDTEYNLNQAKVSGFVDALFKVHEAKNKNSEQKSQLFDAEETPISLQISGIKIPKEERKHLIKM